ncbi:unnamed protein product [Clonostachys rhizophaga]|uniref:Uncharacterized protein n=1 Tax=Clonostachys rhizophaga TaxID=160324 RepID=A0A9N9VZV2_9HYPO|nr:unnamed protein product [Clonostachys rhizophaga]
MAHKGLRFPPALQIFPNLRHWRSIRPRRLVEVPIGHNGQVSDKLVVPCLRHLYHDLGVLVYSGLNHGQIVRVGEILRHIANSGGPGKMITMTEWAEKARTRRLTKLGDGDLFEAVDVAHGGIIKPQSILRLADESFQEHIRAKIEESGFSKDNIQLRDRYIIVRSVPSPKGIITETINGPRRLSIDIFTSLKTDERNGHVTCEMQLYTAGKGEYAGNARVDYQLLRVDDEEKTMKPLQAHLELDTRGDDATGIRAVARKIVKTQILAQLWKLEGETWAGKADRFVNYTKVGVKMRRPTHQGDVSKADEEDKESREAGDESPPKDPVVGSQ